MCIYVTVPSRIKSVTSGGNIDTKKDSLIKLNCEADGNPVPNITWTRKVILYIIIKCIYIISIMKRVY
jgi:hypothetical protein